MTDDIVTHINGLAAGAQPYLTIEIKLNQNMSPTAQRVLAALFGPDPTPTLEEHSSRFSAERK